MRIYTVHELKGAPVDGEGLVFVHEGFSWPAFLLPLLWLLYERLWLALLVYVVLDAAFVAAAAFYLGETGFIIAALAFQFAFATVANDIRRGTLSLGGYREIALAPGRDLVEAEREFFRHWKGPTPAEPQSWTTKFVAPAGGAVWPRRPVAGDRGPIGLFPEAGT